MISQFMKEDHRHCDENFGYIEELVEGKKFTEAKKEYIEWKNGMETHLTREEECLFPKAEAILGGPIGPIMVMKMEHQQMRDVFKLMENAINQEDAKTYLGASESCMMLIQQHNMKEEQILYPMLDRILVEESDEILNSLSKWKI